MRSNTTTESIQDGIENGNKSTVSAQLNKDLFVTSKIPKTILRRNVNTNKNKIQVQIRNYMRLSNPQKILELKYRMLHSGLNGNATTFDATNKQNNTNGYHMKVSLMQHLMHQWKNKHFARFRSKKMVCSKQ